MKAAIPLPLALFTMACGAASGTGVPDLSASDLVQPTFAAVQPRELAVRVLDNRKPAPESSEEAIRNLRGALTASLKRSGFALRTDASNHLTLTIEHPDQLPGDFSKEDCIRIQGELRASDGRWARTEGTGCYEYRHAFGFSLGGDSTQAYRTSVNYVLEQLDRQFRGQPQTWPPRSPPAQQPVLSALSKSENSGRHSGPLANAQGMPSTLFFARPRKASRCSTACRSTSCFFRLRRMSASPFSHLARSSAARLTSTADAVSPTSTSHLTVTHPPKTTAPSSTHCRRSKPPRRICPRNATNISAITITTPTSRD